MKLNTKLSILLMMFLVVLTGVEAASPDYEIKKVEINDRDVTSITNYMVVERGESIGVDVFIDGQVTGQTRDNVRVKVWLGGYEYGEVTSTSESFKVESDGSYKKTLFLRIPSDIQADVDADVDNSNYGNSKEYSLHVEVFDDVNREIEEVSLKIGEKQHDLRVLDAVFRPSRSVNAGDMVFLTVRAENMGDNKEEDIQVRVSSAELGGVLARDYVDELVPEYAEDRDSDEETSGDVDLYFKVPEVATGDYGVKVELIYNRGHSVVEENFLLHVEGKSVIGDENTIVSVDSTSKELSNGKATYKLMIANFGESRAVYSTEVLGVGVWATSSVEPGFVSINSGDTGELFVTVNAKADVSGTHPFTIKVKSDGNTVREINLVAEGTSEEVVGSDMKRALEIGFIVLAVLLVVLGLIIAFSKLKSSGDDEEEEPLGEEGETAGQTYY